MMVDTLPVFYYEKLVGYMPSSFADLVFAGERITFAIIEHDMDVIAELCDPIYVLAEGRTLTRGTFREVSSNHQVMQAYLGKVVA